MATEQKRTIKSKLDAVLENAHGAKQFIKAHAEMVMHVENWAFELMAYRLELTSFINDRGKDINNFNDVVQYGTLFLASSQDFLRGEHIKQEVPLTTAEKKELREELSDAFSDDRLKDQLLTKSAAIGWVLYDIMLPHIDQQLIEAIIKKKLASIRLNLISKFATDEIGKAVTEIRKGALIAARLEDIGLIVKEDETVECQNSEIQQTWDKLQDPEDEDRKDITFTDEEAKLKAELKVLETPIAKMVLECHHVITL